MAKAFSKDSVIESYLRAIFFSEQKEPGFLLWLIRIPCARLNSRYKIKFTY